MHSLSRIGRKMTAVVAGVVLAATIAPTAAMADEYVLVEGEHHFAFPGIGVVVLDVDDLGEFTVIAAPTVHIVTEVITTGGFFVIPTTPLVVDVEEIEPGTYEVEVDDIGAAIIEVHEDGTLEIIQPLEGYSVVFVDGEFHLVPHNDPTVVLVAGITKVIIIIEHDHHHHHDDDDSS